MASNIFRGQNYLFSASLDPLFALLIGISAATVRIRREETCHRLGLPSSSMISLIEQERTKYDSANRERDPTLGSIGTSREADWIRRDTARGKRLATTATTTTTSSSESSPAVDEPSVPMKKGDGAGGLAAAEPSVSEASLPRYSTDGLATGPVSEGGPGGSSEEYRRRDEAVKKRYRDAQPSVLELGSVMGGRLRWYTGMVWREYWAEPWFWTRWGKGGKGWQLQSSDKEG